MLALLVQNEPFNLTHNAITFFRRNETCDTVVTLLEERGLTWLTIAFFVAPLILLVGWAFTIFDVGRDTPA